ncbi:hypothetical protein LCGC14_2164130 [marine sediment metagenome]|uniref:Uncharacterized protein n=1 Tax=marine sediment metagenome TaxID=412755 RepID=A0A0F9DRT5_9ZZZZ
MSEKRKYKCPNCHGTKKGIYFTFDIDYLAIQPCKLCHGQGKVSQKERMINELKEVISKRVNIPYKKLFGKETN